MNRRRLASFAAFALAGATLGSTLLTTEPADAFCGFYVGGAGAKLFNDATMVVLMREGTRTVLSMQNAYKGPPEKFAMIVPVPVVLQQDNVKTLKKDVFEHLDQLASPRLVEYWEQDPCAVPIAHAGGMARAKGAAAPMAAPAAGMAEDLGVKVEAQFTVGEYQIVILSAKDSGGLDTWLHQEGYNLPEGGEPYFRPYVASGSKFFVAKVDPAKVDMKDGVAQLSPLRFHYDSDSFTLPVRLGLINSSGVQDLIVHILGRGTRYEVANYPNVTIPTNLDVSETASDKFGSFYTTLFDKTVEKNPKAVVTEYAWQPTTCDPCPGPPMDYGDLTTLGLDALPSSQNNGSSPPPPSMPMPTPPNAKGKSGPSMAPPPMPGRGFNPNMGAQLVLTRLHVRYTKESLGEDLVFKEAPPIVGGREMMTDGKLEHGAQPSGYNNFQARYAIRHPWAGPIECKDPRRGVWGGKPGGNEGAPRPKAAAKLNLTPHTAGDLATYVRSDIPELSYTGSGSSPGASSTTTTTDPAVKKGCLGCAMTPTEGTSAAWLAALGAVVVTAARRLRRRP